MSKKIKKGRFSDMNRIPATPATATNAEVPAQNILKLELFDAIGYMGETDTIWLGNELRNNKDATAIELWICSPGGSVSEGVAIYNILKTSPLPVAVHIVGIAASIATVIAMAGDKVYMEKGSMFMIHNPSVWMGGESKDLQKGVEILNKMKENILDIYTSESGADRKTLSDMMDAEAWLTVEEAKALGFVDGESLEAEATDCTIINWADAEFVSEFSHVPAACTHFFAKNQVTPPKKEGAITIENLKKEHQEVYALAVADGVALERARITAHNNWSGKAKAGTILANIVNGVAFDDAVMTTYTTEFQMKLAQEARVHGMPPEAGLNPDDAGQNLGDSGKEKSSSNIMRI